MPTLTIYPITGRQLGPLRILHRLSQELRERLGAASPSE